MQDAPSPGRRGLSGLPADRYRAGPPLDIVRVRKYTVYAVYDVRIVGRVLRPLERNRIEVRGPPSVDDSVQTVGDDNSGRERSTPMRRLALACTVALLSLAWMAFPAFSGKEMSIKGKEISVVGKVTCTFCALAGKFACEEGCCERCIKAGDPALLTDADGNQYILLSGEHEASLMTPERYKMLGRTVTVKGVMVKGKGVQAIYVDQMESK
jgi:hypothetical protein